MNTRRIAVAIVALAALVTACSSDDDPTVQTDASEASTSSTGESADAEAHNEADVVFAQGMIPHHEQAIEMAKLAFTRADDERVKELATEIEAAQEPEIATMTSWLRQWGEPVEMEEHGEMDGGSMGGTMSDDDMAQLEAATGAEFDQMFLEMMIEHHRGAIEMAEEEIEQGENAEAVELARTIVDTQQAEIDEMQDLLEEMG